MTEENHAYRWTGEKPPALINLWLESTEETAVLPSLTLL